MIYDRLMPLDRAWDGRSPLTVSALRSVTLAVAEELRSRHAPGSADLLADAAGARSDPRDEVLAMREALVRTRREWEQGDPGVRNLASGALRAAKTLAIDL